MHKQILKLFKKPEKKQYDKQQLKDGIAIEQEHSDSKDVQKIISSNHLDEDPNYYKKLKIMERVKLSDMKKLVKAEDSSKQTIEVTLDVQLLVKLLSDLEVTNQVSLDVVLDMYPPSVYSKIKHLANQENVITHDTLDRFIQGLPKKKYHYDLTPILDFNANVEKQSALEDHANSFEPDEHIDRSNHIDIDKAVDLHVSSFNPIDYIDRKDYLHSMEEAKEMAQHKHYIDHVEMAKDQWDSFEDGKLFRAKKYQDDLDKAKEEHLNDFDPNQYQHNDDLMLPEYHNAVAKAKQDHMSNFDASDIDRKEKDFQEAHGVSSDTPRFEFTLYVHPDMESQIRAENLGDIFDLIYQDSHFVENDNQKIIGWLRTDGQDLSDCFPSFYMSNLIDGFVKLSVRQSDLAEKYWRIWSILLQNLQPNQVVCEAYKDAKDDAEKVDGKVVSAWVPEKSVIESNGDKIIVNSEDFYHAHPDVVKRNMF